MYPTFFPSDRTCPPSTRGYTVRRKPPSHSKVVSLGIDNKGYPYHASLPVRDIHKATATLLHSDCAVQLGLILATGWCRRKALC